MNMIEIDGSYGEGGGQLFRCALAFSAITGKPFRIFNIRANRRTPGLRRQHLGCLDLAARMTRATVSEAQVGSDSCTFNPGPIKSGSYSIDIGAGSLTLLSSVFLPISLFSNGRCTLKARGGTDVAFSPTWHYFTKAFKPMVNKYFNEIDTHLERRGYYPKGQGAVRITTEPIENPPSPILLQEKGEHLKTTFYCASDNLPEHIGQRIFNSFQEAMRRRGFTGDIDIETNINRASNPKWNTGVSAAAVSQYGKGKIAVSGCGKRGVPSERIGKNLAKEMRRELEQPCVDSHLADQLLPYIALFGGRISVKDPTEHFLTEMFVMERFIGEEAAVTSADENQTYEFDRYIID